MLDDPLATHDGDDVVPRHRALGEPVGHAVPGVQPPERPQDAVVEELTHPLRMIERMPLSRQLRVLRRAAREDGLRAHARLELQGEL